MKETKKEVIIVNHGKVFNNVDWYTFYCPVCKAQVSNGENCKCGEQIKWTEAMDEISNQHKN